MIRARRELVEFGRQVRAMRLARGWSQEVLAEKAELDRTYVGGVERGERNVSLVNIHKLARSLGVPLDELFREKGLVNRVRR